MEVPAGGGQTILVVEDDELVRPSVETLIESLGYRVLSARNGPDALEILRQDTPIDLLFTDVFMPGGMYGPKLVAEARRLRPELKVLRGCPLYRDISGFLTLSATALLPNAASIACAARSSVP
jgi:CheY-like chemotaxis protein